MPLDGKEKVRIVQLATADTDWLRLAVPNTCPSLSRPVQAHPACLRQARRGRVAHLRDAAWLPGPRLVLVHLAENASTKPGYATTGNTATNLPKCRCSSKLGPSCRGRRSTRGPALLLLARWATGDVHVELAERLGQTSSAVLMRGDPRLGVRPINEPPA